MRYNQIFIEKGCYAHFITNVRQKTINILFIVFTIKTNYWQERRYLAFSIANVRLKSSSFLIEVPL